MVNPVILLRELRDPVAPWSVPGVRYVVEYWMDDMAYPVGQAWVCVGTINYIDWIYVMEEYRRKGIGKALLMSIIGRWPDIYFDASTELGEHLINGVAYSTRTSMSSTTIH